MQIRTTDWRGDTTRSVADYVIRELESTDPDGGGAVEDAARVAAQTARAVGRLVELLADKGLVDADQVVSVVGGYDFKAAKFVD